MPTGVLSSTKVPCRDYNITSADIQYEYILDPFEDLCSSSLSLLIECEVDGSPKERVRYLSHDRILTCCEAETNLVLKAV